MAYAMILKGGSSVDLDVITASASDVLAGKVTVDVEGETVNGTMTNNGAVSKTFTPSASAQSYTIPKGYHNGSGKVTVNAIANPMWTGWKLVCKHTNVATSMDSTPVDAVEYDLGADFAKYNTFIFRVVYTTGNSSGDVGTYTYQNTFVCTRKADDASKHTIAPNKISNASDSVVYRDLEYSVGVASDNRTVWVDILYDGESETTTRYGNIEVVLIAALTL